MKTIDEMAREAGFVLAGKLTTRIHGYDRDGDYTEELKAFAALVRADERADLYKEMNDPLVAMCKKMVADEREACAKVCDDKFAEYPEIDPDYAFALAASDLAKTIRARGQA